MCGIAGILNLHEPSPIPPDRITRMLGAQKHRGPDESGTYLDDWIHLGQNRLSIIDLAGGTQPIHNEDQHLWIIYNGEVFNYIELRQDLIKRGHRFYTATDTEVILHLFEERGPRCLEMLNGQFAIAIWDSRDQELFLARDRVGIRPIHYTITGDTLIFASEIKAIFSSGLVEPEMDLAALDQIFTLWTTLPGRTAFKGIKEVPAGHYVRVSAGKLSLQRYWDLPFHSPDQVLDWPVAEICEKTRELLLDSTRIRLRADVPVGAYLSGGLDSSGVSTLIKRNFDNSLKTFGIRFEETAFDEGKHQEQMVEWIQTQHTALTADNFNIGEAFAEVLWHCEKPLLRTAPVPLFLLSRMVRDSGLKVVLTGEGADEVFGGYNIFRETKARAFWARRPQSTLRPLLLGRLYPYVFRDKRLSATLQSFFGSGLDKTDDPLFSHMIRWQNTRKARIFFSEDLKQETDHNDVYEEIRQTLPGGFADWDPLSKAQYLEMAIFLSNYLLSSQGDRVAMAHSVEIRLPYLDYRLIEFMGRIPPRWKMPGLNEKFILKKTFKDCLPKSILYRPKHPYRAPISPSLMNGNIPYIKEMLSERCIQETGLFDPTKVSKLLQKLSTSSHPSEVDNMALAGILSTQIIHDQFIRSFPYRSVASVTPDLLVDRRSISSQRQNQFLTTLKTNTSPPRHKDTKKHKGKEWFPL
jgi:asparagine synthase (glutamine-hydrolysing)